MFLVQGLVLLTYLYTFMYIGYVYDLGHMHAIKRCGDIRAHL